MCFTRFTQCSKYKPNTTKNLLLHLIIHLLLMYVREFASSVIFAIDWKFMQRDFPPIYASFIPILSTYCKCISLSMNLYIILCIEYESHFFFSLRKNDGLSDVLKLNEAVQSMPRHYSMAQNKRAWVKCSMFHVNKIDLCSPPFKKPAIFIETNYWSHTF